ncbi:phage protein [Bacillus toyonensis]|nr:hypothetical protein IEA_02952 [Bacillus toyonensis]EJV94022.1 hypothetical protein IGI_02868 [Bacillus toyonensis]EOP42547.1 phage protein [Bacillus toyonensis]
MKVMENGVYATTKLVSESKGGQAVMNINQICELDQYQEATLRTWNANNDFGGRVLNAALGLTGEAGEVADIVKKLYFMVMDLIRLIVQKKRTGILIN